MNNTNPIHQLLPTEIDGFDSLAELALDLHSTWNHATDEIWRDLDEELWAHTHNPWAVLQTASRKRIAARLSDSAFRERVDGLRRQRRDANDKATWFEHTKDREALQSVAYFSMEFMLSESLPIYSGGLGNVAGDQLKAASDLDVPVIGVGLLYQQGYFRQAISADGSQRAMYPYNDPGLLPITPLRTDDGEWLRLRINLPGHTMWLRCWQVIVGRRRLYLLDSNDPANFPAYRGITSELYGGDRELRLLQELILGIGGLRMLAAMGIQPDVCHLNEGHAAFAVLERAQYFMQETGQAFDAALTITRVGNLFTTHTAVPAGFDRFEPRLIEQYLSHYATEHLGISVKDLLALGRKNANDDSEPFNMAYLAVRGCGAVNGVSQLHGQVSRQIFAPLFPHWPADEVPIGHVTNGVHVPTWDSAAADELWTNVCGECRWNSASGQGTPESLADDIRKVSDEQLWKFRIESTRNLIEFTRDRLSRQLAGTGSSPEQVEAAKHLFDPTALTLGFARRFATYKRPNLLLHDPDRLLRLLTDSERPVQLILSGKAHPADQAGQELIRRWIEFIRRPEVRPHVVFLSDYDMQLALHLVQGVDVWINTPRRPWEASGTSGMKVLVNGGLNLSEIDGWWAEAYAPEVGWAIGDGEEHGDDPNWDAAEANQLYEVLENDVVPEFYDRNEAGIPSRWLARMRESMAALTPRFSAARTVSQYTEQFYVPAAKRMAARTAVGGAAGTNIVNWKHAVSEKWSAIRFVDVCVQSTPSEHRFHVQVDLDGLAADSVQVELYADGTGDHDCERKRMTRVDGENDQSRQKYELSIPVTRPADEYTARIIPHHDDVTEPLELPLILWQRS